jgi:glucose-1-phosphate thymidylyltransferase
MTEKSPTPETNWVSVAFYWFPRADAGLVAEAIADGCGTDAPGSYLRWLCDRRPVYAMEMPGKRYDIGDMASYEQAENEYPGILR